jgi:hypothetical protein
MKIVSLAENVKRLEHLLGIAGSSVPLTHQTFDRFRRTEHPERYEAGLESLECVEEVFVRAPYRMYDDVADEFAHVAASGGLAGDTLERAVSLFEQELLNRIDSPQRRAMTGRVPDEIPTPRKPIPADADDPVGAGVSVAPRDSSDDSDPDTEGPDPDGGPGSDPDGPDPDGTGPQPDPKPAPDFPPPRGFYGHGV